MMSSIFSVVYDPTMSRRSTFIYPVTTTSSISWFSIRSLTLNSFCPVHITCSVRIPTNEIIKFTVSFVGNLNVNFPSTSVATPKNVFASLTVTPGNGLFSVSVTTPLISINGDFSSRFTEITTVFPVTLYVRFVPFNAASSTSPTVALRKSKVIPFTPATACALKKVW